MNRLRHLPLRLRAWLISLFGVAALAVMIGFLYLLTDRYSVMTHHLVEEDIPVLDRVSNTLSDLSDAQSDLLELIHQARLKQIDESTVYRRGNKILDRVDRLIGDMGSQNDLAQPGGGAGKKSSEEAQKQEALRQLKAYRATMATSIEMVSVDLELSVDYAIKSTQQAAAINRLFSRLLADMGRDIAEEGKATLDQIRRETPPTGVLLFALASLFLLLQNRLINNIRTAFQQVIDTLERLRSGDTQTAPPSPSRLPEMCHVTQALDKFRETLIQNRLAQAMQEKMLAALKKAKQGLEEKVERRTQNLQEANALLAQEISRREADERRLRLYHKVFESTDEAVLITDPRGSIIEVNAAYLKITGFSREEVIGKNPKIAQSGRHDKAFYKAMWDQILATGNWAGEIWDRRRNGEIYPKWLNINLVRNEKGEPVNYVGVFMDISHMKAAEEKLETMAYFDPLTHCPNRALFRDRLAREVEVSHRHDKHFALLFVDLDRFKDVNDTLGHIVGDLLLVEIAQRIRGCIREEDTLARLGGDEFTIIIRETDGDSSVIRAAECIIQEASRPVALHGSTAKVGASIGIAIFPQDGADAETLTQSADSAMYRAKGAGRGQYYFFGEEAGKRQQAIKPA